MNTVPAALPGIVFLSGGQTEDQACEHLMLMNQMQVQMPWPLSFSYGRALQASALQIWAQEHQGGDITKAQDKLLERAQANSAAAGGQSRLVSKYTRIKKAPQKRGFFTP